jgi:hypothetical protein
MAMANKTQAHRNRFLITAVVLCTFFLIMMGIGLAILGNGDTPSINQEWKEILLLVLGAFLGSYSRVIDFWFNGNDTDMDGKPDVVAPEPTGPNFCENCGDQIDYDNF